MRWVLALLLCAFLCALPADAARSSGSKTMTIRLVSVTTQHKVLIDRAPKQFSIGDVIWAKSTLRNEVAQFGRSKGSRVGTDVATFAVVSRTKGNVKVTTTLPGGTLRAAGRIGQEPVETIRVLGGTGAFAGASGVYETRLVDPSRDRARNVFRLQLP